MNSLIKKLFNLKINLNFLFFCLAFSLPFVPYLFTMAPSINREDTGELVAAAFTLGIPHPSGYPLWTIIGHLFTYLPIGTIAWKINLASVVFASLTCGLIYLISEKITKNKIIALACSLILAFSFTFWSQALIAKFYPLNSFLVTLLIYFLLLWQENKKSKYLYLFAFFYGLCLTNHTMSILFAPAFALFILLVDFKILRKPLKILLMFLLFLAGLSVYLYLFWRGGDSSAFIWTPILNWQNFLALVTRRQYFDFSPFEAEFGKVGLVISFFVDICYQFFIPAVLLAFIGAYILYKKNRNFLILTLSIFILNSLGIIYLRKFGWSAGVQYTYRVYYLPAFCIIAIWLSVALSYVYNFISNLFANKKTVIYRSFQSVILLAIISLPISFFIMNYDTVDQSDYWFGYDYSKNILASLEPNAIYLYFYDDTLQADTEIFNLAYFKKVEKFRPDVTIVSEQNFFKNELSIKFPKDHFGLDFAERQKKLLELVMANANGRPVYTNFAIVTSDSDKKYFSKINGYAFKIYPNVKEAKAEKFKGNLFPLRNSEKIDLYTDYANLGIAAHYYYNQAYFFLSQNQPQKAQACLIKAFNLDPASFSHEYRKYLTYRFEWQNEDKK